MKQQDYETILKCIQYGAPAIAEELINSFNQSVELANQKAAELRDEMVKRREEEMKRQQEEKEKAESKKSNVTK